MDVQTTLIILGICGFLTVCFGLLVLAFVTIFRYTGRNFLGFLGLLARNKNEDEDGDSFNRVGRGPDLRSIAANADFDAALAKHVVQDELAPTHLPPTASAQNAYPAQAAPQNPDPFAGSIPRRYSAPQQGTIGQAPVTPPPVPQTPPNAGDFGWVNPALPSLNNTTPQRDPRRRRDDEEDDLIGGLMGDDDGGVLG